MSIIWNTAVRFELGRRYFTWKEQKLQPNQRMAVEVAIFLSVLAIAAFIILAFVYIL